MYKFNSLTGCFMLGKTPYQQHEVETALPAGEKLTTRKSSFKGAQENAEVNRNPRAIAVKEQQDVEFSEKNKPESILERTWVKNNTKS